MPELPEVEVVKLGLELVLTGHRIKKCSFSNKPLRLPIHNNHFERWVLGTDVMTVSRRAKYILIKLTSQAYIIIHLGMTGKLGLFSQYQPRKVHDHACFLLENGMELRFNDVRRFGSLQVVPSGDELVSFFKNAGPEPFTKEFSAAYLSKRAEGKSQPVKNFIMDCRTVAGIGNIYANEILFESAIMPEKPAGKLSFTQWKLFVGKTRSVLKRAITAGGSTVSDFVGTSGEKGYFQLQLNVYGKQGQNCPVCGKPIEKKIIGGRASFFCMSCQK